MTILFADQRLDGKVRRRHREHPGPRRGDRAPGAELGAAGIVVCGREPRARRGGRDALAELGSEAVFVAADLADEDDCRAIVRACEERFGRLDGLVNSAGLTSRGTLDDTTVELWDRIFAVNVRAPFLLMQEAARLMRRGGDGGSIVNIITMASHGGEPVLTAYAASKAALATLTAMPATSCSPTASASTA